MDKKINKYPEDLNIIANKVDLTDLYAKLDIVITEHLFLSLRNTHNNRPCYDRTETEGGVQNWGEADEVPRTQNLRRLSRAPSRVVSTPERGRSLRFLPWAFHLL